MIKTFEEIGGTTKFLLRNPIETEPYWSAFNPSIARSPDGQLAMMIRSSNYHIDNDVGITHLFFGAQIMSRTWFAELDEDLNITRLQEVKYDHRHLPTHRGVEDARLYWRDGWEFTAVIMERPHTRVCRLARYSFNSETCEATLIEKLETPTPARPEKNWMAADFPTEGFDFVYSYEEIYKDSTLKSINPPSSAKMRGGSGLITQPDGTFLAVVHQVEVETSRAFNPRTFGYETRSIRNYTHHLARYSAQGRLEEVSDAFVFTGPGIEYAAGLVEVGSDLVISWGKRDIAAFLAIIPKSTALKLLRKV